TRLQVIKRAAVKARGKGLRLIHFSVQSNHLHLLLESANNEALARGIQSFATSLAKNLNSLLKRQGTVFRDRYHLHILKTAREVKHALIYVFQNFARHTKAPGRFDPFSSLLCFPERGRLGLGGVNADRFFPSERAKERHRLELMSWLTPPRTWPMTTGRKKTG